MRSQRFAENCYSLLVMADRLYLHYRARIIEFATKQRLPGRMRTRNW